MDPHRFWAMGVVEGMFLVVIEVVHGLHVYLALLAMQS